MSGDGIEAFDPKEQKQLWASEHEPLYNLLTQNGRVYGHTSNNIYAVDEKSGEELLHVEASGDIEFLSIGEDGIYANINKGDDDFQLEAYEKESGNQLWNYYAEDLWNPQFTISNDTIYTVDGREFISLDSISGEKRTIKQFDPETGASPRSPTINKDTAFVPTSEYLNFPAIDLQSQQEIQEWDYEGAITAWKPVVAGDLLYVSDETKLYPTTDSIDYPM
ncbi:PQQ-binding-like beta-propeller repeat protein [Halostagnicola sp. A56]|uniref:outer membrane protein assembly factor BamB family protein n=1 Tax=Halostagnicola sp. A56 TaxID=1495067 RepID=UPI0018CD3311|nr:PQQ-binding-like beta-propeller repeat protein [Halostagnicola sp. A56]